MRTYAFSQEIDIIVVQRSLGYFVAKQAHGHALEFKKNEFLTEDLPQIFKAMKLLNISLEDVKQLFNKRIKHEKE